jgi:hypothetical protein
MFRMYTMRQSINITLFTTLFALILAGAVPTVSAPVGQGDCRLFPETGKSVCGRFLAYWDAHGGLAQQGYPVSAEFQERSEVDGKSYMVQYFERAVFELHPENKPPFDVLLSLLGRMKLDTKYGSKVSDGDEGLITGDEQVFPETGKKVSGVFLEYWKSHGGLAQQGYPISNAMYESITRTSPARIVQYFERAVFELHPDNESRFQVLLSRLGAEQFGLKYPNGEPQAGGDAWAELRARPLKLSSTAPGTSCPADSGNVVNTAFGPVLGSGPAYPVGFGTDGVYDFSNAVEEGGWYLVKVLWVGDPAYTGPILVRGRQLDGPGELRFGPGANPSSELQLDADAALVSGGDWFDWPGYTRLKTPGCYAYQVDGTSFSKVITFRAAR